MGVRGLLKLLQEKVKPEQFDLVLEAREHHQQTGDSLVLALDLSAFAFWVFDVCYKDRLAETRDICQVASYNEVGTLVKHFVEVLHAHHVALEAFMDGAPGAEGRESLESKLVELSERRKQRLADIASLERMLNGTLSITEFNRRGCQWPLPCLFIKAVTEALREARVPTILAVGEADPMIAHRLRREPDKYFGVVGNDSDFALMRGGRFIAFSLFDIGRDLLLKLHGGDNPRSVLNSCCHSIRRWTPELLATSLQVHAELLPAAAFLCGTDHSRDVLDKCRNRGLSMHDTFTEIAKELEDEWQSVELDSQCHWDSVKQRLCPYLNSDELSQANVRWKSMQTFYGYGESGWEFLALAEMQNERPESVFVQKSVTSHTCSPWLWPAHRFGIHVLPSIVEHQRASFQVRVVLQPIWEIIYALVIMPGMREICTYTPDPTRGFRKAVVQVKSLDLAAVLKLPNAARFRLWEDAILEGEHGRATFQNALKQAARSKHANLEKSPPLSQSNPDSVASDCHSLDVLAVILDLIYKHGKSRIAGSVAIMALHEADDNYKCAVPHLQDLKNLCEKYNSVIDVQEESNTVCWLYGKSPDYEIVYTMLEMIWQNQGECPISTVAEEIYRTCPGSKAHLKNIGGVKRFCEIHKDIIEYVPKGSDASVKYAASMLLRTTCKRNGKKNASNAVQADRPISREESIEVEEVHRRSVALALRLIASKCKELNVCAKDFDALALMAMLLLENNASRCLEADSKFEYDDMPNFSIVALGECYQSILFAISELAELLSLSSWGVRLLSPMHCFNGALFRKLAEGFKHATLPWSKEVRCLRADASFASWRKKVLQGLPEGLLIDSEQDVDIAREISDLATKPLVPEPYSKLPIDRKKAEVMQMLQRNRVVCLHGATGSGKSTQVPQYLLELYGNRAQVIVTQPRRMAALKLAERIASELGEQVGESVAYCIRGETTKNAKTRVTFMTTGFFLQLLVHNPSQLQKITHIVLDEVHERSAEADMLSLVLKLLMSRHPEVRLIIMSATLEASLFQEYFRELLVDRDNGTSVPIPSMLVGERPFEVQDVFLDDLEKNFRGFPSKVINAVSAKFANGGMDKATPVNLSKHAELCEPLILEVISHLARSGCTVLVFLPGLSDISSLYQAAQLPGTWRENALQFHCFAMHSMIPQMEQEGAFQKPGPGTAHVVFASNIAESSLTLPNVNATVDVGLHRRMRYDQKRKTFALVTTWISRASATQRSGRAGRTMKGIGVHLYPRSFHEKLAKYDPPEVTEAPIPRLYLEAKLLATQLDDKQLPNATSVLEQLVEPPDLAMLEDTRKDLAALGALSEDDDDAMITPIGRVCLTLPFDLDICRLVWLGVLWGCAADAVVLACCSGVLQDPFTLPSPYVMSNTEDYATKLQASCRSRRLFDRGLNSEPLMLRCLFLEWWYTRPSSTLVGYKSWAHHTEQFARKHSVIKGRFQQFVCTIIDTADRTLKICNPDSDAAAQLRGLLRSLGSSSGGHVSKEQNEEDWTNEWPDAFSEMAGSADKREKEMQSIFESSTNVLQSLLAAAFSSRIVIGSMPKKSEEQLAVIRQQGLDPVRTAVVTDFADKVPDRLMILKRLLRIMSGGLDFDCKAGKGKSVLVTCTSSIAEVTERLSAPQEEDAEPWLADVDASLHILNQFGAARKLFTMERPKDTSDATPNSRWFNSSAFVTTCGSELLNVIHKVQSTVGERHVTLAKLNSDVSKKSKKAFKRFRECVLRLPVPEDWGVGEEGDLHTQFFEQLQGFFVLDSSEISVAATCREMLEEAEKSVSRLTKEPQQTSSKANVGDEDEQASKTFSFKRDWISHPSRPTWHILWAGAAGYKGGERKKCKGIPDWRNPPGFACHVFDVSSSGSSGSKHALLGCTASVQFIDEQGNLGIMSGFTSLRCEHVPLMLLTIDPIQADLRFGLQPSRDESHEGPQIVALRAFGEELPCDLKPDDLESVNIIREELRRIVQSHHGSKYALDDSSKVKDFVHKLSNSLQGHLNSETGPSIIKGRSLVWCDALDDDLLDTQDAVSCYIPLYSHEDVQTQALELLQDDSWDECCQLRTEAIRLLRNTSDQPIIKEVLKMLGASSRSPSSSKSEMARTRVNLELSKMLSQTSAVASASNFAQSENYTQQTVRAFECRGAGQLLEQSGGGSDVKKERQTKKAKKEKRVKEEKEGGKRTKAKKDKKVKKENSTIEGSHD